MRSFPLALALAVAVMGAPAFAQTPPAAPPSGTPAQAPAAAAPGATSPGKPLPPSPPPAATAPAPTPPPAAPPPAPKKHGPRTPGVLLMVLGAAGLASGAVLQALESSAATSARSQCTGTVCPPSAAGDIAQSKNFQAAAIAAFIGGGAIAAAGLIVTIVAPGDPVADDPPKTARVAPWVTRGAGGLGFSATF